MRPWLLSASIMAAAASAVSAQDSPTDAAPVSQALYPVRQGGKTGYIDRSGKTVIEARFAPGVSELLGSDRYAALRAEGGQLNREAALVEMRAVVAARVTE